jgi:hypothetical protein
LKTADHYKIQKPFKINNMPRARLIRAVRSRWPRALSQRPKMMGGTAGFHDHMDDGVIGPEGQKVGAFQSQGTDDSPGRGGEGQLKDFLGEIDGDGGHRSVRLHGGFLLVDSALNFDTSQRGTMMPSAPREESIPSLGRTPEKHCGVNQTIPAGAGQLRC